MRYLDFLEFQQKNKLEIFSNSDVEIMLKLSTNSAKTLINRYLKDGLFIKIKKGLYYSKDLIPNGFNIASSLIKPSYISLETALSEYGLIPEIVYSITSITTKTTTEFNVKGINYIYKSVKKTAFTGYIKKDNYLIAKPEKALADYFYFVSLGRLAYNDRINTGKILKKTVLDYIPLFQSKSLDSWIKKNYA